MSSASPLERSKCRANGDAESNHLIVMVSNWKISDKLLGLNILVFLVLTGMLAVVIVSFRQTRHTITTITQREVTGMIENAQTGRELTSIFADLLTSIFYGNKDAGEAGLQRLDLMIQSLTGQEVSLQLQHSLQAFAQQLTALLDQSARLKTLALQFSEKEEEFLFNLEMLNDVIKEKIDTSNDQDPILRKHLEQLQATIIGFRGAFNQIISQATELQRSKAFAEPEETETTPPRSRVIESLDYLLLRFQALTTTNDEDILESGKQLTENVKQYQAIILEYQETARAFQMLFQDVTHSKDLVITALNEQEAQIVQTVQQMEDSLESENQRFSRLIAVLAVMLFMVIVFSSYIVRKMVSPLIHLAHVAKSIAKGEMDIQLPPQSSQDEIGILARAFGAMQTKLTEVVREVKASAQDVAQRSREMGAAAEQLSESAAQQAAATQEVAASMEEMAANIQQNADHASEAKTLAQQSAREAQEGCRAVTAILTAMRAIARHVVSICKIADETKMLSLNASIEASKAQDYGKGFAVVATSVRDLAHNSRDVADAIEHLVDDCLALSEQAGDVLQRLAPNSEKTAELVQEIHAASQEEASGAAQINQAVQQLDQTTQQTAATSEQVAVAAESLSEQAAQLQQAMAFFTVKAIEPPTDASGETEVLRRIQELEKELHALRDVAQSEKRLPDAADARQCSPSGDTLNLETRTGKPDALNDEFEHY